MSNARKIVDHLLGEGKSSVSRQLRQAMNDYGLDLGDIHDLAQEARLKTEDNIGDVVDQEMDEEAAAAECWDLASDHATGVLALAGIRRNDFLRILIAKEVCRSMGYGATLGYGDASELPARPQAEPTPEPEPERVVKPTGVYHGPYRPAKFDL